VRTSTTAAVGLLLLFFFFVGSAEPALLLHPDWGVMGRLIAENIFFFIFLQTL
jgi:hypothetical protein